MKIDSVIIQASGGAYRVHVVPAMPQVADASDELPSTGPTGMYSGASTIEEALNNVMALVRE